MAVIETQQRSRKPRVAVTLGDPAGIGPELIAKLLSNPANLEKADVLVMADHSEVATAFSDAANIPLPASLNIMHDGTASSTPVPRQQVSKAGGERCLHQFRRCLDMSRRGEIDAVVFAPLNKSSLKLAGVTEEDELRWFAKQLEFKGTTSEINIAGPLWTARVTSHVGIEKVADMVTKDATLKAIELLHRLR